MSSKREETQRAIQQSNNDITFRESEIRRLNGNIRNKNSILDTYNRSKGMESQAHYLQNEIKGLERLRDSYQNEIKDLKLGVSRLERELSN